MSSWVYGFVEVKEGDEKKLVLAEVYIKNNKPFMWTPLNWSDFKMDRVLILKDLIDQSSSNKFFKESDFK